jgi:hypothetical protein
MSDMYSLMAVMAGNLVVSLGSAFQLLRHKKQVTEFTTLNKSNLKFFRKIIEEKNSVYEFIYDLHVTLTDFHQVLTSICSLNHSFSEQVEIENNPDLGVYLLSSLNLIAWLEKKKLSCSAMSAMHIGGFKDMLDELAFFFHTCKSSTLRVTLLEQKYITEWYTTNTSSPLPSLLANNSHIQKLGNNISALLNELTKRKKKFLELECVDEFIFACFLETLLEKNSFNKIYDCSCFANFSHHFTIRNILAKRETVRLSCRVHSKVKELFLKKLKTSLIHKEMTSSFYNEVQEENNNFSDFMKTLKTQFHEDLYHMYIQHEFPSINELHDKIKLLTLVTENILSSDALVKEKLHKRVFESQLLM